jgi:hypothetical protein
MMSSEDHETSSLLGDEKRSSDPLSKQTLHDEKVELYSTGNSDDVMVISTEAKTKRKTVIPELAFPSVRFSFPLSLPRFLFLTLRSLVLNHLPSSFFRT